MARREKHPVPATPPHVLDALPCQPFDPRRVIEDLDRNPAVVANFLQCLEDRHEVQRPEAGALPIGIVGMEMGQHVAVPANQLDDRRRFGGHRLAIEVQLDLRRTDAIDQFHGLGGGEQEVRFLGTQRLQGQHHAVAIPAREGPAQRTSAA